MEWLKEQWEKFKELFSLIITIVIDFFFVIFVAWGTEFVKGFIERKILHGSLNATTNEELHVAYTASQILVISVSIIYVAMDIVRHLKKAYKEIVK